MHVRSMDGVTGGSAEGLQCGMTCGLQTRTNSYMRRRAFGGKERKSTGDFWGGMMFAGYEYEDRHGIGAARLPVENARYHPLIPQWVLILGLSQYSLPRPKSNPLQS